MTSQCPKLPKWLKPYLGPFGVAIFDEHCGLPISMGFPVIEHMGETLFEKAKTIGGMRYDRENRKWYFVTSELTYDDAVSKYGHVTNLELGPQKGFRSVTFGTTKFTFRGLDPRRDTTPLPTFEEEVLEPVVEVDTNTDTVSHITLATVREYLTNEIAEVTTDLDRLALLTEAITNLAKLTKTLTYLESN